VEFPKICCLCTLHGVPQEQHLSLFTNSPDTADQDCHLLAVSQTFPSDSALQQNPLDHPL